MQEAVTEHWGHVPTTFERYAARHFERESFDPSLYLLAMDGEAIAGAVLCQVRPDMGWIGGLGVRKPWRRRGLGEALLLRGFAELYGRGIRHVGLGVDAENATGATRLYEHAGMRVSREWIEYEKELRAAMERRDGDGTRATWRTG
jgi:mycothiol synthase